MQHYLYHEEGFSLLESLLAMFIMSVLSISFFQIFKSSYTGIQKSLELSDDALELVSIDKELRECVSAVSIPWWKKYQVRSPVCFEKLKNSDSFSGNIIEANICMDHKVPYMKIIWCHKNKRYISDVPFSEYYWGEYEITK